MTDTFAEIERLRVLVGVSQLELCRLADMNQSTYSRYRSGGKPSAKSTRKLMTTLRELKLQRRAALEEQLNSLGDEQ